MSDARTEIPMEGPTATNPVGQARAATTEPALFLSLIAWKPTAPPARWRLGHVDFLEIGRGPTLTSTRRDTAVTVRVPDTFMSKAHARLLRDGDRWVLEDGGSKNGSLVNGQSVKAGELRDGDVIELGQTFFVFRQQQTFAPADPEFVDGAKLRPVATLLATVNPELARCFAKLADVAASPSSVIIGGNTGTGKEILARALHDLSRRIGEFVAVNCGALPDALVEAALFGHRRGAFTGANQESLGLVRSADDGTLFLDEIGDLPAVAQTKLLRVLDQQSVVPVGSSKPIAVNFRVISATLRNLDALVSEGRFRADLLARLGVVRVDLPLLRDRREDMGILIAATLRKIVKGNAEGVTFTLRAARALMRHEWPLNVRELYKSLEAATAQAKGQPIDVEHLPAALDGDARRKPEEATLHRLLLQCEGNVSKVVRLLGKDRKDVYRLFERYNLDPDDYRRPRK